MLFSYSSTSGSTPTWPNQFVTLISRLPPTSTLFPYTTLFRSDTGDLSLQVHDWFMQQALDQARRAFEAEEVPVGAIDRKSTRLNSSHVSISYAVFCLKKKKQPSSSSRTR